MSAWGLQRELSTFLSQSCTQWWLLLRASSSVSCCFEKYASWKIILFYLVAFLNSFIEMWFTFSERRPFPFKMYFTSVSVHVCMCTCVVSSQDVRNEHWLVNHGYWELNPCKSSKCCNCWATSDTRSSCPLSACAPQKSLSHSSHSLLLSLWEQQLMRFLWGYLLCISYKLWPFLTFLWFSVVFPGLVHIREFLLPSSILLQVCHTFIFLQLMVTFGLFPPLVCLLLWTFIDKSVCEHLLWFSCAHGNACN